jgi:hypothetical protein
MFVNRNTGCLFRQLCCSAPPPPPPLFRRTLAGKVSFAQVVRRQSGEGEGLYPVRGVGYPRLTLLRPMATRVPHELTQNLGRAALSIFAVNFAKKLDHFGGGGAPCSSPRGGLDFRGKAESPFSFINSMEIYICTANWGVGYVNNKRNLEILSKGRSDVAVGCSKRW